MPLGDAYVDAALDAVVGSWPASGGKWRLYASDPRLATVPSDVELASTGGYAAQSFAPSDFAAASGDAKTVGSPISFGTSTDAYSDVAPYWGITSSDPDDLVFSDDLPPDQIVEVDEAATSVTIAPTLSFADGD